MRAGGFAVEPPQARGGGPGVGLLVLGVRNVQRLGPRRGYVAARGLRRPGGGPVRGTGRTPARRSRDDRPVHARAVDVPVLRAPGGVSATATGAGSGRAWS